MDSIKLWQCGVVCAGLWVAAHCSRLLESAGVPLVVVAVWAVVTTLLFCGALMASLSVLDPNCSSSWSMWGKLVLDMSWLLVLVPPAVEGCGVFAAVIITQLADTDPLERAIVFVAFNLLGFPFVSPYLPYVWPIFYGRSLQDVRGNSFAITPVLLITLAFIVGALGLYVLWARPAMIPFLVGVIVLTGTYAVIHRRFPRFVLPPIGQQLEKNASQDLKPGE